MELHFHDRWQINAIQYNRKIPKAKVFRVSKC